MAASVTQISPNAGVVGDTVTITGSGFGSSRGSSTVSFFGTAATSYPAWSATSLSVTVPSGPTPGTGGRVTVTVGGLVSNGYFFWYSNAAFPTSAKIFTQQNTAQDSSPENITVADARDINQAYDEVTAIEEDLLTHLGIGGAEQAAATATVAGFLSAADKSTWDGHYGVGGSTHAAATTSANGFLPSADKTKLDGLTYWDSGWTSVGINTEYTFTHSLNTNIPLITIYMRPSPSSPGQPMQPGITAGSQYGPQVRVSSANAIVAWARHYTGITYDGSDVPTYHGSSEWRVLVRKGE